MGEGAIEGNAEDYHIYQPSRAEALAHAWERFVGEGSHSASIPIPLRFAFNTRFKFSRFDASSAPTRNISRLVGDAACRPGPSWNATGGATNFVVGLNFEGYDLVGQPGPGRLGSALQCYSECRQRAGCAAFTFITNAKPRARACWLKRPGFARAALYSAGTISGVLLPADVFRNQLRLEAMHRANVTASPSRQAHGRHTQRQMRQRRRLL